MHSRSILVQDNAQLRDVIEIKLAAHPLLLTVSQRIRASERMVEYMLWTILMVLLVLWLAGLIGGIGGSLIHLLLVVALIVLVLQLITGRRAAI